MTTETTTTTTTGADQALKAKHRAMWALGDYPALAADLVSGLGPVLVEACGVGAGGRVLDVTAVAPTITEARDRAYEAAGRISWPGMQYRRDIGAAAVESEGKEPA